MSTKQSNRKAPPLNEIASISEDSTGHLEVTREQHLRMIRNAAARRNSERGGNDKGNDTKDNNGNRNRTKSSDATNSNMKSRLATLTKLMRVRGNQKQQPLQRGNSQQRLMLDDDTDDYVTPRASRSRKDSSVCSSQMAGDNGSVNSSVAVESIANVTEASLDTVKVSNISEKTDAQLEGGPGSGNKKNSVVKQWNKFKRMMGVKNAPEESILQQSTFNHRDTLPLLSPHLTRDRANTDDTKSSNSRHSGSNITPWRRVRSDGASSAASSSRTGRSHTPSEYYRIDTKSKNRIDDMIRGRLDGLEMLSLSGEQLISTSKDLSKDKTKGCNLDDFVVLPVQMCTFSGKSVLLTNAEIVSDMIWNSGGCDPPEIILDGISPGPDGRWTVRLESVPQTSSLEKTKDKDTRSSSKRRSTPPSNSLSGSGIVDSNTDPSRPHSPGLPMLQPSFASSDGTDLDSHDGPFVPTHILQKQLWGPDGGPIDLKNLDVDVEVENLFAKLSSNRKNRDQDESHSGHSEDPLLSLAAKCSIPIDVDEDTFIISTREHVHSIHEIASASLSKGQFTVALRVFETLLKGLNTLKYTDASKQSDKEENDLRFSKGATMHNIGILQLWLGRYADALKSFENAVTERIELLPKNHGDICVSLVRQAIAAFALSRTEAAKEALEQALTMVPSNHIVRAKILNNLGVIYFRENNLSASLKELTKSLEIQRFGLDAPVRRPNAVYDAAVTLCNMGKLYLERNDFDLSLYLFEEALLFQTSMFRKDHPIVLDTLKNLAISKGRNGEIDNAIQILQGCLRSQTAKYGNNSSAVIETVGLCGCFHARNHDYSDALQCFVQIRKWQKSNLPSSHPALKESKELVKAMEAIVQSSPKENDNSNNNSNSNGTGGYVKSPTSSSPKVWV